MAEQSCQTSRHVLLDYIPLAGGRLAAGLNDVSIGAAGLMGIAVKENFNQPYKSQSVTEMYTRWHMTLSEWMRDIVFFPLSCSPFQAAGANILLLAIERFKSTAVRQGKRHDHENDG